MAQIIRLTPENREQYLDDVALLYKNNFYPTRPEKSAKLDIEDLKTGINEVIDTPSAHYFLVLDDEKHVVGAAIGTIMSGPITNHIHLNDVVAEPGGGYGQMAVEAVIDFVKAAGRTTMEFTCDQDQTLAQQMYQSMGFKKRDTVNFIMDLRE